MPYITRTEVALSKTKLSLSLLGCVAFVAIGIWLFSAAPSIAAYPIIFCQALGIISIVFFGFIGVFIARKLQDNKPGLIIDEEGITDNSSAVAGGSIVWRDIKDIYVIEIGRQKLMMIEVVNPEKYIERQAHYLTKKLCCITLTATIHR